MDAVVIIPARYASTRYPGKVLAHDASGKTMLQYVCEAAAHARRISGVIVATDDERVRRAVRGWGGEAIMTSPSHPSGTDRVAQVARKLSAEIVVNVQGDEPEILPEMVDQVVDVLEQDPESQMSTLACPIQDEEELKDPSVVKVVLDERSRALYFSRFPIPYVRDLEKGTGGGRVTHLKHVGIYGYRRGFLLEYAQLEPSMLERSEKLEQLRALSHGYRIAVGITPHSTISIDTPEDFRSFLARLAVQGE